MEAHNFLSLLKKLSFYKTNNKHNISLTDILKWKENNMKYNYIIYVHETIIL